jgi:hypothetical protein
MMEPQDQLDFDVLRLELKLIREHLRRGFRQIRKDLGQWNDHLMVPDSCDRMYCRSCRAGQMQLARRIQCLPGMDHKWREHADDDFCLNCHQWQYPLVLETECSAPPPTDEDMEYARKLLDIEAHWSARRNNILTGRF